MRQSRPTACIQIEARTGPRTSAVQSCRQDLESNCCAIKFARGFKECFCFFPHRSNLCDLPLCFCFLDQTEESTTLCCLQEFTHWCAGCHTSSTPQTAPLSSVFWERAVYIQPCAVLGFPCHGSPQVSIWSKGWPQYTLCEGFFICDRPSIAKPVCSEVRSWPQMSWVCQKNFKIKIWVASSHLGLFGLLSLHIQIILQNHEHYFGSLQ